jgi:hypothetical protein
MCQHAINLGLLRLAEGEDPIDPAEEQAEAEVELEREFIEADEPKTAGKEAWSEQPEAMVRAVATENAIARLKAEEPELAERTLWFSYAYVGDAIDDVVVFPSELDALRHAVTHGYKARPLKLGESLIDQVRDAE